jgi:hypothetical protein
MMPKSKRKVCPKPPPGFKNMIRLAQGKKLLKNEDIPHDNEAIGGGDSREGAFPES